MTFPGVIKLGKETFFGNSDNPFIESTFAISILGPGINIKVFYVNLEFVNSVSNTPRVGNEPVSNKLQAISAKELRES